MIRQLRLAAALAALALTLAGCGIYSFSGTSIRPDVHTITIEPVLNNSMKVNPALATDLTEALKDKFKKRVGESIIIHPKQFSVEDGVMKIPSYMAWCI